MSRKSPLDAHPEREIIDALVMARVPLTVIGRRFGTTGWSIRRYRQRMLRDRRTYANELRRALRNQGLNRRNILEKF